jgi:PhoH-like ATPase
MKKKYFADTNILIDNPDAISILRNGEENEVYITYSVLTELDRLKKDPKLKHIVSKVIDNLITYKDEIKFLIDKEEMLSFPFSDSVTLSKILDRNDIVDPILVSNDKLFRLIASLFGVTVEDFKESSPFKTESETYTGFSDNTEEFIPNSFLWDNGKLIYNSKIGKYFIDYQNEVWKIKPRTLYQNLALELMFDPHIHLLTLQSDAGFGKTFLSIAYAINAIFDKENENRYEKIYIIKSPTEIGKSIGYLPGDIEEKLAPYFSYIDNLISKLNNLRPISKIFVENNNNQKLKYNKRKFEIIPPNYLRGATIENAVVIIEELQNFSRYETRSVLSRMGENVKCICTGDTNQIDNENLNEMNNGLNWVVKCMKGLPNYGHMVLKGEKSRGPITDLVRNSGL